MPALKPKEPKAEEITNAQQLALNAFVNNLSNVQIETSTRTEIEKLRITSEEAKELPDVTLRDFQSAVYELNCQYDQIDRITDLFHGVELNHSRLYPAVNIYPNSALYPGGSVMSSYKSNYSQLWADEGNVRQLAYLFAGSEENCVPLASIVEGSGNCPGYGRGGSSGIVIPDGCNDAARFFQVGT